jgi:hypothetical protein
LFQPQQYLKERVDLVYVFRLRLQRLHQIYLIYNMTVTQIPTNKPVQRDDKSDLIYISQKGKFDTSSTTASNLPF